MNWTEGTLVRHSRPSKGREVLLRQKEHFAKARAGVLNSQVKTSPPSISFLTHPAHSSPIHHSSKIEISISHVSKQISGDLRPVKRRQSSQKDDGLNFSTIAGFQQGPVKDDVLRQKRRKLLLKGDWTGINTQTPINMELPKPRESSSGPWAHSKSRQTKSKRSMRRVLGIKYDVGHTRDPKARGNNIGPASPIQMRIRVGSRERVFGGSSDISARSKTCRDVESSSPGMCGGSFFKGFFSLTRCTACQNSEQSNGKKQACFTHGSDSSTCDAECQSPRLPELHQPWPQRRDLPPLPHPAPNDSSDAVSTLAQVGIFEPDVPASQMVENEEWESFVRGARQCNDSQPFDCPASSIRREISPGISQYGLSSQYIGNPNRGIKSVEPSAGAIIQNKSHLEHPAQGQKDNLWLHESRPHVGGFSKVSEVLVAADEAISSSTGSSPRLCKQHSRTNKCIAPAKQPDLPEADENSLRVMPTSCSPTDDCLPRAQNHTNLQDDVGDEIAQPILPRFNVLESNQESMKLTDQQKDALTRQQQLTKPPVTKEDHSDVWQHFIFGNNNNIQEAAEEARKETVRNLRPSDPSTGNDEDENSEPTHLYPEPSDMNEHWESGARIEESDSANQQDSSPSAISTMAPVSHIATQGDSSSDSLCASDPVDSRTRATRGNDSPDPSIASDLPDASTSATTKEFSSDPLSALDLADQDATAQSDEVTVGTSSSSSNVPVYLMNEFLSRSDVWSLATQGPDSSPTVAHPPSISGHNEADDSFKFARPKPFLGKKKAHLDEQRQIALSAPQIRGKSMTWRRQKRTGDGRACIRQVPDLNSDPIEEVEDAVPVKRAQQPSLFASLDTEEDLL